MAPAGKQVELHDLQGKAVEHIGGLNSEWSATTAYKACQSVGLNALLIACLWCRVALYHFQHVCDRISVCTHMWNLDKWQWNVGLLAFFSCCLSFCESCINMTRTFDCRNRVGIGQRVNWIAKRMIVVHEHLLYLSWRWFFAVLERWKDCLQSTIDIFTNNARKRRPPQVIATRFRGNSICEAVGAFFRAEKYGYDAKKRKHEHFAVLGAGVFLICLMCLIFTNTPDQCQHGICRHQIISFFNCSDPLITPRAVVTPCASTAYMAIRGFLSFLCELAWTLLIPFGIMVIRHAILSFRRILRPSRPLVCISHTHHRRNYNSCSSGPVRCRNQAVRCIDFYMRVCVAQRCHLPFMKNTDCTKQRFVSNRSNAPRSFRSLKVAIQTCLAGTLLLCVIFTQQWNFTCGFHYGPPGNQIYYGSDPCEQFIFLRKMLWWIMAHQGFHRFWIFPDWFHDCYSAFLSNINVWKWCQVCSQAIYLTPTVITPASTRQFRVCQKCAWTVGYNGVRVGEA